MSKLMPLGPDPDDCIPPIKAPGFVENTVSTNSQENKDLGRATICFAVDLGIRLSDYSDWLKLPQTPEQRAVVLSDLQVQLPVFLKAIEFAEVLRPAWKLEVERKLYHELSLLVTK